MNKSNREKRREKKERKIRKERIDYCESVIQENLAKYFNLQQMEVKDEIIYNHAIIFFIDKCIHILKELKEHQRWLIEKDKEYGKNNTRV